MLELPFEARCLSSLSKVFPDEELSEPSFARGTTLRNERYSFQIAYRSASLKRDIRLCIHSPLGKWVTLSEVGLAPSELPVYEDHDEDVLRIKPGLYPDPLHVIDEESRRIHLFPGQWRSVWVSVSTEGEVLPGVYSIGLVFETQERERLGEALFELEIIPALLPEQRLIHTEWFHTDCLAVQYRVEIFGEEHWRLIEKYVNFAVRRGVNMILTPLFTLPLDTEPGGERPMHQLIDVEKSGSSYRFGFGNLLRWVETCLKQGVQYFEFSHLFTQWGAKHAPKIVATEDGMKKQIFGWQTDAGGEEYRGFLSQFLPLLVRFIREHGLESKSYFHISDEPNMEHAETYLRAKEAVVPFLEGFPVIDALSDYELYRQGIVEHPIPSNDHIRPFLESGVPELWTYYCCSQYKMVSNRFFCMPSLRNRILGIQLYKFRIAGFLHWGYNFWNSQYSRKELDPYRVTDAGGAFPSGDAFLVYPGNDGNPVSSIRFEVLHQALQDLRALQLLEALTGRESVEALLEEGLSEPLAFDTYPKDQSWLIGKREQINSKIKELSSKTQL